MIAYVGQTRSEKWIEKCNAAGLREMTNQGEAPPRRFPFALDNGAFKDWKASRPFNEAKFLRDLERVSHLIPDFVVVPDYVGQGLTSLAFSLSWVERLRGLTRAPLYLAVQDGMTPENIASALPAFDGIFVGGTSPWKFQTAHQWVQLAHEQNWLCHIGRAGTLRKVQWARRIGADSVDSCYPLWSEKQFDSFVAALSAPIERTPFGW